MSDDFLICDEKGCNYPIKLVAFDTGVEGSYCLEHLHKKMKQAGVVE